MTHPNATADPMPDAPGSTPSPEDVQAALVEAIHAYARLVEDGVDVPPLPSEHDVTQTEVVLLASRLLQAAEVELFELAMWQISGNK